MKYIRDRGMKSTKIFAILMALGVMASGVYGMTQAGKNLVDQTVNTLHLFTVGCSLCTQVREACMLLSNSTGCPCFMCTVSIMHAFA